MWRSLGSRLSLQPVCPGERETEGVAVKTAWRRGGEVGKGRGEGTNLPRLWHLATTCARVTWTRHARKTAPGYR